MEVKLRELFGEEMREYGKQGGEINFLQYLEAVQRIQVRAMKALFFDHASLNDVHRTRLWPTMTTAWSGIRCAPGAALHRLPWRETSGASAHSLSRWCCLLTDEDVLGVADGPAGADVTRERRREPEGGEGGHEGGREEDGRQEEGGHRARAIDSLSAWQSRRFP